MRKVTDIAYVEKKLKDNKPYTIMHVQVGTGDETYRYYGDDLRVGDLVEVFHDAKWDVLKVRKPK